MPIVQKLKIFYQIITKHKKLFFLGLVIKIILGTFLGSDFLVHLFSPFLKYATTKSFTGVYEYFNMYGRGNEFPYPSVMLIILAIPKLLLSVFTNNDINQVTFIDILSVRIALLIADAVILYILLQWLKKYTKQVMLLYWLSPIFIYINYIHGQLDVIPVALLFASLYYLFKNKFLSTCIYLALAIGCKSSIVLALPFILIYGFKTNAITIKNFYKGVAILIGLLILINFPIFYSKGYWQMVYNNNEQVKLFSTYLNISNSSLFLLVPAIYLLLVMRFWGYWQMSRNLLLMYLGFAFGLITIFIAANQGWYYWCLPFFIYFLIKENRYALLPFLLINIFYFLHFALIPNSDFARVFQLVNADVGNSNNLFSLLKSKGLNVNLYSNLLATFLQASIIGFCYFIYKYGISQIQNNKMLYQPYIIGISGDSASGKTTLATLLQQLFKPSNATIINGDDMHKWERGDANWNKYTHLNPSANNLHLNMFHFLSLLKGKKINRQHYNHQTGTFTKANKIDLSKIIIFEGLHTYFLEYQKSLFDLKIFMKPEEGLRTKWKMERDTIERGHKTEDVLLSIAKRKPDADAYIAQQENDADVIISLQQNEKEITSIELKCLNHFYVEEITNALQKNNVQVSQQYTDKYQILHCKGAISKENVQQIANDFSDELETLGFGEVEWKSNYDGIIQLLLVQIIFNKMQLQAAIQNEGVY